MALTASFLRFIRRRLWECVRVHCRLFQSASKMRACRNLFGSATATTLAGAKKRRTARLYIASDVPRQRGLKRRPLGTRLSPPDVVRPRGCPPPDPGHKGVPPLWNPDQRTASLGTCKPELCRPWHPCPTVRQLAATGLFCPNQPRQPSPTAPSMRPNSIPLKPRFPPVCPALTGGLLGCDQTRRETRVEKSDCASVALSRRDGRHPGGTAANKESSYFRFLPCSLIAGFPVVELCRYVYDKPCCSTDKNAF